MKEQRLEELFQKYISRKISSAEEKELMQLLTEKDLKAKREVVIENAYDQLPESFSMNDIQANEIFRHLLKKSKPHQIFWKRIAVAASIVLAISAGTYFLFFNHPNKPEVVKTPLTHDIAAPTVAKATLKLADGTIVYLDSAGNGSLAIQGNVNVVKLADGQIKYSQGVGGMSQEVRYNTISNPRGSKVQSLMLTDGTQVWLNAESSITYPTAFVSNERKVSITGEAYFEAAHNTAKKFIVESNGIATEVLGTHFNVNSYNDEKDIKVTLLEGSVKMSMVNGQWSILKPGEQAQVSTNIKVVKGVDLEEVMAWKEGKFYFMSDDIKTVMRQLARWYDVDVEYKDDISNHFTGIISSTVNASEVFKMLEQTGAVHFIIDGKRIIVQK